MIQICQVTYTKKTDNEDRLVINQNQQHLNWIGIMNLTLNEIQHKLTTGCNKIRILWSKGHKKCQARRVEVLNKKKNNEK